MKRKLFSAILFGALLVTSTSGLTSCKDYDDDIQNLQGQIDKLATKDELSAKANELASSISAAQQAANAAADVAKAAQTAANNASSAADAASKAAKAAQTAADNAQAAADKVAGDLKTAVENAAKQIQEAVKDLATKKEVADAVKDVADKYDAQAKKLKALSDRLDKVEAKLGMEEGGEDIDLTEIQAELEDIEDAFEALVGVVSDMVTSVELVYSSAQVSTNNLLDFKIVTEKKNETFGKDVADKILTTANGYTRFEGDDVIIRVNPVDAEITAEDVALINSKGEEISDVVKAIKVERYSDNSYITRSTGNNTGLWKVTYAPVEGKKADDLKKKFLASGTFALSPKYIAYAVSVKSAISDSISANRRVVSAYDVAMKYTEFNPYVANLPGYTGLAADDFVEIKVNGNLLETLKNRNNSGLQASSAKEYIWNTNEPSNEVKTASPANVKQGDQRWSSGKYLIARVGEDIKIKFTQKIKGFYVRLDYDWVEQNSAPSELNAWNSYKYVNVGTQSVAATMFEGNEGTIKVSELSGQATGDVIGFRIYAMNLDGTLVDPDGMAFYVNLGDNGTDVNLGAKSITVTQPTAGNWTDGYSFTKGTLANTTDVNWTVKYGTTTIAATDATSGAANYEIQYHVNGGTTWEPYDATNAANYDAVKFNIKNPVAFKDNGTFDLIGEVQKQTSPSNTNYTAFTMTGTLTKKLPDSAPAFTWNEGQDEEQIVKTANYDTDIEGALCINGVTAPLAVSTSIKPANPFTAKDGNLNYNDMFIQSGEGNPAINSDGKFIFSLAATVWNSTTSVFDPLTTPAVGTSAPYAYNATIPSGVIDCKTPHAVSAAYNYGAISSEDTDPNASGVQNDWKVSSTSSYSIKYMTWSYKNANYLGFEWATKKVSNVTYTYDVNQTLTNIKIATDRFKAVHGSKLTTSLRKATLKDYLKAGWLQIESVKTIGVETGIVNPYYEWDATTAYTDYTVLGLKKKAGVENIPAHSEKIQITVVDCFGHKETHELVLKFTIEPVNANAWLDPSV